MEKVDITRDFAGLSVPPSPKCQKVLAPFRCARGASASGVVLVPNFLSPTSVLQQDNILTSGNRETLDVGKEKSSEDEGNNALLDKGRGRADDVHMFD